MRHVALILLILSAAGAASDARAETVADTLAEAERPCRLERLDPALAACLGHLADQREMLMAARIDQTLTGLQAASAAELAALAARYREAQAAWRAAVAEGCAAAATRVEFQRCRLEAALLREDEVALSLARAAAYLGGPDEPDIFIPGYVEIPVLLDLPGSGLIIELPVLVPLP